MATRDLTAARLRELLHYDPDTGSFAWRVHRQRVHPGDRAGSYSGQAEYLRIRVDYRRYAAHRLAFLYVTGAWPVGEVDHINGFKWDNRWSNLRDVSRSVNAQNMRRPQRGNKVGVLGVRETRAGRYRAQVKVDGSMFHIGTYGTAEEAGEAYRVAKTALHDGAVTGLDRGEARARFEGWLMERKNLANFDSITGFRGVSTLPSKRFGAKIQVGGEIRYLGTYDTPQEAHLAYLEAREALKR